MNYMFGTLLYLRTFVKMGSCNDQNCICLEENCKKDIPLSNILYWASRSFLSEQILHAALFASFALVIFPVSKNACAYLY